MRDYEAELGIDPTGCMVEGNQIVRYSFARDEKTPVAILATYKNKLQALAAFASWLVHCQGRQGLLGGLLAIAQRKASNIDGSPSPITPNETRGMGGVSLSWHPYECKWWVRADWSDGSKVGFACNDPVQAVQELIRLLDKEQGKEQERKNP